jgi:hypothetical protein
MVWQTGFGGIREIKRKVFISYHHGGDQPYYDALSRAFSRDYDIVTDNSLARGIESDVVEYIMRRIRENYITGALVLSCWSAAIPGVASTSIGK